MQKLAANELLATQKGETRALHCQTTTRGRNCSAIQYHLTQPLRVLSQVLVHVPIFRIRAGTTRRSKEQEGIDINGQVSFVPLPFAGRGSVATTNWSHRAG